MGTDKGLWQHLEEIAPSEPSGRRRDWFGTLEELQEALEARDFDGPIGQLETELDRAGTMDSDFPWRVERRDGLYHFIVKT